MASFGSFETEREVYSDPTYTVFLARKSGDPVTEYAVKVFRLPVGELETQLTGQAVSREEFEKACTESIDAQERAAASSRFIAPVLERGKSDRGVWYATRFYPRSINKMMSGKVALPRASLEHLICSIAQGALDFKQACHRSHGDLRPTNIQVSKSEKLTEAEVVLSDPLPAKQDQEPDFEKNDLHAIGVILLELVRQRAISAEDLAVMVPIGPSDEWVRIFGSDASDWLALCNRLLDPHLSPERFKLEDLVARLNELKPKRRGSPKLALAAIGAVLFLVLLCFWLLRPGPVTVEVTSDPPGATVLVDGTMRFGPAPTGFKLSRGKHVVEARLDEFGLAPVVTNCVVNAGPARVHLQFAYGNVAIQTDPSGATILKDGIAIGTTTPEGRLFIAPPGLVKYQLKLAQYEPAVVTGIVVNLQRLELSATLRRSPEEKSGTVVNDTGAKPFTLLHNGALELSAQPTPASVFDAYGRQLGLVLAEKPLRLSLAPGTYSLTARAEGLDDVVATLKVEPDATKPHVFVFDFGTVDWTSQPVPATVWLGKDSRPTPARFLQKPGATASYVITAPGYQTVTDLVVVANGEVKATNATLVPQILSLELLSDPPGADFFGENGGALARCVTNQLIYYLPWGSTNLVARYAALGMVTNHIGLKPNQGGSRVQFKFDYGTLILTNLPLDTTVYDGQARVGSAADKQVYQKRGNHLYALRGQANTVNVSTNINTGLNFLSLASPQKSWKNSFGMWFAWVPNLPGGGVWPGQTEPGGWVGLTEVTQDEYKKMNGNNPSVYRDAGDNYPVENLTREQAEDFCQWLSSGDTAERLGWRYALPTDLQFTAFAGDADRVLRVTNEKKMNYSMDELFPQRGGRIPAEENLGNGPRKHPEPVASTKQPNQFGLYDVVGNVWEWLASSQSRENVYAGGSYLNFSARTVGVKAREKTLEKGPNIGFRVILVPPR